MSISNVGSGPAQPTSQEKTTTAAVDGPAATNTGESQGRQQAAGPDVQPPSKDPDTTRATRTLRVNDPDALSMRARLESSLARNPGGSAQDPGSEAARFRGKTAETFGAPRPGPAATTTVEQAVAVSAATQAAGKLVTNALPDPVIWSGKQVWEAASPAAREAWVVAGHAPGWMPETAAKGWSYGADPATKKVLELAATSSKWKAVSTALDPALYKIAGIFGKKAVEATAITSPAATAEVKAATEGLGIAARLGGWLKGFNVASVLWEVMQIQGSNPSPEAEARAHAWRVEQDAKAQAAAEAERRAKAERVVCMAATLEDCEKK